MFSLAPASKLSLQLHFENPRDYSCALVHSGRYLLTPFLFSTRSATERNGIDIYFFIAINHATVLMGIMSDS